jgi:hypothetical protein
VAGKMPKAQRRKGNRGHDGEGVQEEGLGAVEGDSGFAAAVLSWRDTGRRGWPADVRRTEPANESTRLVRMRKVAAWAGEWAGHRSG